MLLSESRFMDAKRRHVTPAQKAVVQREAKFILDTQYLLDPSNLFYGALNDVPGLPTFVVPRENALAILGLVQASQLLKDSSYRAKAELAADFLVRIQPADGGWYDQYDWRNSVPDTQSLQSKSPTQTAEVMMAFDKLGFSAARYDAMKKSAEFLIRLQDAKDGLIVGGYAADGTQQTWKWASDNSFAYLALKDAASWAKQAGDRKLSKKYNLAAEKILQGINEVLYIDDPANTDFGVWHRVVDFSGVPQQTEYREWINYAPQMLDLPAVGVGNPIVGEWIHDKLQLASGAVVWAEGSESFGSERQSPGFSFQASLVWLDLGQKQYANAAISWVNNSGLLQTTPDGNGVTYGWVDWLVDNPSTPGIEDRAPDWQRFIDTSFYSMSVTLGGYDFRD